jgi:hypothetical protein
MTHTPTPQLQKRVHNLIGFDFSSRAIRRGPWFVIILPHVCLCCPAAHTHLVSASSLVSRCRPCLCSLAVNPYLVSSPPPVSRCDLVFSPSLSTHTLSLLPRLSLAATLSLLPRCQPTPCLCSVACLSLRPCLFSLAVNPHLVSAPSPVSRCDLVSAPPPTPCRVTSHSLPLIHLVLAFSASDQALTSCRSAGVLAGPFVESTTSSCASLVLVDLSFFHHTPADPPPPTHTHTHTHTQTLSQRH